MRDQFLTEMPGGFGFAFRFGRHNFFFLSNSVFERDLFFIKKLLEYQRLLRLKDNKIEWKEKTLKLCGLFEKSRAGGDLLIYNW